MSPEFITADRMHESLIPRLRTIRACWSGLATSTETVDHVASEQAVRLAYRCAGLDEPSRVLWVASPRAAVELLQKADESTPGRPGAEISLGNPVDFLDDFRSEIEWSTRYARRGGLGGDVVEACLEETIIPLDAQIIHGIDEPIIAELVHSLGSEEDRLHPAILTRFSYTNFTGVSALVWAQVLECLGAATPRGGEGIDALARSAHWLWALDETAVMCERPVLMRADERGLVPSDGSPVITYADGWGF